MDAVVITHAKVIVVERFTRVDKNISSTGIDAKVPLQSSSPPA